jgi:hypothetical protein
LPGIPDRRPEETARWDAGRCRPCRATRSSPGPTCWLLAAKENGELPDGVTFPGVYKWLTAANILLIGWYEIDGEATPEHREMLQTFLLPAFRKP